MSRRGHLPARVEKPVWNPGPRSSSSLYNQNRVQTHKEGAHGMQRIRITIRHNPMEPADDLRKAARVRRDLWAHSPVEIDPDSPAHGTHRDANRNAYFEFATGRLSEVERVLREYGHDTQTRVDIVAEGASTECVNCGNISPQPFTVCPTCQLRDIAPCPYCNNEIPRLEYTPIGGDLFRCPMCHHRVRFRFNEPLLDASGDYNQPIVLVSPAEATLHGL
jgi:hypothetical protein